MSVHQFVRYIPTALTEKDLLELIYKYWPHPNKRLSKVVLNILAEKIATELVPPKETQALKDTIKKVWKKRKKTEKDDTLGKLSDEQEQLLKKIFDNFSRAGVSLHTTLLQKISIELNVPSVQIKNIWKHRKLSKHFEAFEKKQATGAKLTPEENELLDTIWKIWPRHQRNFNIDKMYPLIKAVYERRHRTGHKQIQLFGPVVLDWIPRIPTREDVIDLNNFRGFSINFSHYGNRLCAATDHKTEWLFDHYCEQGDDINEFGGYESAWKQTKKKDENGNTIYKKTQVINKEKVVKTSIVDQRNEYKKTPLEIVCQSGYIPIFNRLLKKGADVTLGRPLHRACDSVKNEIIAELLKKEEINPQLNQRYDYNETTPLLAYIDNAHPTLDTVKLLLEKGADPNIQTLKSTWKDGERTALMLCCEGTKNRWPAGHKKIFAFLVQNKTKYKVNLDAVSQHNFSALHYAVKYKQLTMVRQLLEAGADPNIKNQDGQTPLNLVLCDKRLAKMKELLQKFNATAELGSCRLLRHSVETRISLIHQQVQQEIGERPESPTSVEMKENDKCVKFSMSQGNVGICYMVSVITLFRNEYTLLNKLEECLMDVNSERQNIVQPGRNALSKAVTKAKENGIHKLFLKKGVYEEDSEIEIDFTKLTIIGESRHGTVVKSGFVLQGSTELLLETLTVTNMIGDGVYSIEAAQFHATEVSFNACHGFGIFLQNTWSVRLTNCAATNCGRSGFFSVSEVHLYGEGTRCTGNCTWGMEDDYELDGTIILHAPLTKESVSPNNGEWSDSVKVIPFLRVYGYASISKAVAKAKENGITEIFLENGTHKEDSEIVIDFTVTIIGASRDNTIVHTEFKVIGDSTEFSLKTITLYNSQTSGLVVNDAASFYVENVTFTEGMHHAVEALSNSKGTLINCIVENCGDSAIYCDGNAVVDIYGEKTEFKEWGSYDGGYGLYAASSSKIVLHAPLTKQSILNYEYIDVDGNVAPIVFKRCGGNIVEDGNVKSKYKIVYEMVDFLTKDYSKYDFTKTCPIIPKSWQSAVSSKTGEVALEDVNDGGDSTSLMLYILYSMHSAFPNIFKINVHTINIKNENMDEIFAPHWSTFMTWDDNISFVDVRGFNNLDVCVSAFDMLEKPFRYPQVRAMLVIVGCGDSNHVFTATVCEDEEDASKAKVFYCNSWGKGCVLSAEIVQEMSEQSCPKIEYVQYLLRK